MYIYVNKKNSNYQWSISSHYDMNWEFAENFLRSINVNNYHIKINTHLINITLI
mgnify:CR=1 FL=1